MHDLEDSERLVEIAELDFTALRATSDETVFDSPVVGFHAQLLSVGVATRLPRTDLTLRPLRDSVPPAPTVDSPDH